ncbi:LOW QUALITY PROTEIN: suppressor of cytokine signaling 2 [Geothlypis trichas]
MTLRSAESLESAESSGERWGHPGAAAPVAEGCREAEQLAAAMEELRRAGKPGRPGRGKRPGRRRCPGGGRAARRGSPPGRGYRADVRRLANRPPGAARSRSRGGEGRRRLRPYADCGGRSESAGSAAPQRQPRVCGRARAGRCRRPGRPHPLGPAYLRSLRRRGGGSPGPAGRGACLREEGRAFCLHRSRARTAATSPKLFSYPLAFNRLRKLISAAACSEFPKRAFCGLPACALRTRRGPRRQSSGEPRDASLPLQGRPAGSAAPVSAPQDAAGKFVHVYAYIGWYWGNMTVAEAKERLQDAPEGTFLVRDSSHSEYLLTISVKRQREPTNLRIEYQDGKFRLDSITCVRSRLKQFNSVVHLIEYYVLMCKDRTETLNGTVHLYLNKPLYTSAPSLQHRCRIAINKSTNQIWELPLPTRLKEYLKEYRYQV